jgi:ubiquinone biosynthesis protein UbiJ
VEYVDRKEDPLLQIFRTYQHNISSAVLQTARLLSTELQRETRQIKESIAEKTKERWRAKGMHEQLEHNLEEELDGKQSFR